MQTKEDLENWYDNTDPWGYETNKDDAYRLKKLLSLLDKKYHKAIDIGAGEGFVAKHLPADMISGIELSETAKSRFPGNVVPVKEPIDKYDLVVSTGTLYQQYDHEAIYKTIIEAASHHILIGGIKDWLIDYNFGKVIKTIEFPYREFIQKMTLYEISPSA